MSISPEFYHQLFCTKVFYGDFLYLQFGAKAVCKMLVQLTTARDVWASLNVTTLISAVTTAMTMTTTATVTATRVKSQRTKRRNAFSIFGKSSPLSAESSRSHFSVTSTTNTGSRLAAIPSVWPSLRQFPMPYLLFWVTSDFRCQF